MVLQPVYMKVPTENMFKQMASEFYEKWNFPKFIGAMVGKHIRVKYPPKSVTMYYNYKHFFSNCASSRC